MIYQQYVDSINLNPIVSYNEKHDDDGGDIDHLRVPGDLTVMHCGDRDPRDDLFRIEGINVLPTPRQR